MITLLSMSQILLAAIAVSLVRALVLDATNAVNHRLGRYWRFDQRFGMGGRQEPAPAARSDIAPDIAAPK